MGDVGVSQSIDTVLEDYSAYSLDFLAGLPSRNKKSLQATVEVVLEAVSKDHLIYSAGAGHSVGAVIETFFRAGGLPFVSPLWDQSVFPLNGASASTAAERQAGLGLRVVTDSALAEGDVLFVFSNSGINHYPVEIAEAGKERGAKVVAVTSVEASLQSPPRAGRRLIELASIVLDTGVPPGDVSWPLEHPAVAPLSTLAVAQLWNLIVVGLMSAQPDLATWQSANTGADDSYNQGLAAHYGVRIPIM